MAAAAAACNARAAEWSKRLFVAKSYDYLNNKTNVFERETQMDIYLWGALEKSSQAQHIQKKAKSQQR